LLLLLLFIVVVVVVVVIFLIIVFFPFIFCVNAEHKINIFCYYSVPFPSRFVLVNSVMFVFLRFFLFFELSSLIITVVVIFLVIVFSPLPCSFFCVNKKKNAGYKSIFFVIFLCLPLFVYHGLFFVNCDVCFSSFFYF